ncbi:MAG: protein kinase, partial [Candidatus Thermoplasmatota archaeon]|nr:protein kinase [Candidatus Thermoplasmatota archaeon]
MILTGLLLFALVPLQRLGEQVAEATMPGVRDDEAYLDQRRIEIYQAALDDAVTADGELEPQAADRLQQLRTRLGLTDRDHALLLHSALHPEAKDALVPTLEPGRTFLSRYEIQVSLGEGGQGATYLARDATLDRDVVIEALHGPDPRQMLKEARALAAINHPNVVSIHDVERVGDHVYLVMEHVPGGTLEGRLKDGPLDDRAFRAVSEDLLMGLHAVHDAGLIHR